MGDSNIHCAKWIKKNGAYKERIFFKLIFTFDKGERKIRKAIRNNCQTHLRKATAREIRMRPISGLEFFFI